MKPRFVMLMSGLMLFFFFILFSFLVDKNIFKQLDFDTTVRLQNNIPRRFDDPFSWFSFFGTFEVLTIILLIVIIANRKIFAGLITFLLFALFHMIEIFGKNVVENLPPPEFMLRTKRVEEFPEFHVRAEYSYPSGHSGRTTFLSVLLILLIWQSKRVSKEVKLIITGMIIMFDCIMLLSRVYLGEHWFTDIIGGALLGSAFACLAVWSYQFKKLK